jgi:hypothetical protein
VGVDGNPQWTKRFRFGDGREDGFLRRGVSLDVADTQFALERLALVVGHVGDDDLGAGAVQSPNGRLAEPACAADDDRGVALDLHVVPLLATVTLWLRE